ncbi:hypothetical protein KL919_004307 [Ogataea angusta]|nr:hypothetical protein KL909_003456 [Ogataea angusta]KAG7855914.1 hypothetical protein KL919_004307 [Ogataea angusta]
MSVLDYYSEDVVAAEEPEILEASNPVYVDDSSYSCETIHPCVSSGIAYIPSQENLSQLESQLQSRQVKHSDGGEPDTFDDSNSALDEFLNKVRERVVSSKLERELEEWNLIIGALKDKSGLLRNAYLAKHTELHHDEPEISFTVDSETVSKILLLLEKVEKLENLTGAESSPIESGSIQLQLNVLTQKIQALQTYMSRQSKKVPTKVAITDSLFSIERESSLLKKIDYLYERYASLRIYNLEKVNTKLRSIGLMANSIAPSSDFLNNADSEFNAMQRQITDWENKISVIEARMAENRKMMGENQSQVEIWIKKLEEKLKS